MSFKSILTVSLLPALFIVSIARAADYEVDPAHSEVGFSVKHMAISTVKGHFAKFSGTFNFDPESGKLGNNKFDVDVTSIDTGNSKRDDHLKSPDFFDAAKYPTITLTNSKIKKTGNAKYEWTADMNMHGVTKPVTFDVTYNGSAKGMEGKMHAAFSAKTVIKRSEWGLKWNKTLEAGGLMVSDDVNLTVEVEAAQK